MSKNKKYSFLNQSIERSMAVLDSFNKEKPVWGAKELSEKLKLNKSTVHRLMETLEYYGMLEQNLATKKYQIGLHAFEIGSRYLANNLLEQCAPPYLEVLAEKVRQSVNLAYLDTVTAEVVFLNSIEGKGMIRVANDIGVRGPCHTSSIGKAIMACITNEKLEAVINKINFRPYAKNTITSAAALRQDLEITRRAGYAIDDQEGDDNVRCVGAPIFNYQGKVIAAVSISGLAKDIAKNTIPALAEEVVATAKAISKRMGYSTHQDRYLVQESSQSAGY